MENYYRSVILNPANVALAIVETATDRHVGNVKIGPINWVHRCAEFGILIGAKDCWGKGYGSEATSLIVEYAFRRLNLHKITLGVHAEHVGAIRAYQHAGFREEGRLHEALFLEGRYSDKVLMGVTAEQFFKARVSAAANSE
jgi:RimJ/RimL family protein N-acetyltransferase